MVKSKMTPIITKTTEQNVIAKIHTNMITQTSSKRFEAKNKTYFVTANKDDYKHEEAFKEQGFIDWEYDEGRTKNIAVGDRILVYRSKGYKEIQFLGVVEKINMTFSEIEGDDRYRLKLERNVNGRYFRVHFVSMTDGIGLTLHEMKTHGLSYNFERTIKMDDLDAHSKDAMDYVRSCLNSVLHDHEDMAGYPEGAKITVVVNKYERDPRNRRMCIDHYGYRCQACGMDFGETYGPLAEGFIHVHHRKPVSEIGDDYVVDPVKDLIPLCPNCHAMVHHLGVASEDLWAAFHSDEKTGDNAEGQQSKIYHSDDC